MFPWLGNETQRPLKGELNDRAKGIMLVRLCFPFSSPDSSVSSLYLSFGISLFWGFAQWYLYSALFFQITPPAARSLHPSRCVFLTPEAFVSFDSSPFPLSSYQALYSSDLLQHSSSAFHLPSLYHTHLILQFLPPPLYHCIHFILLFLVTSSLGIFYHFSPTSHLYCY